VAQFGAAIGTRVEAARKVGGFAATWTTLAAIAVAAFVAVPVIVIAAHLFAPTGAVWSHLAATVLPRYLTNTAWLIVGVGGGTAVLGVGTAWLVTACRFPGRRLYEWGLLLPFAVPAYILAYTYTGLLDAPGPVQTALRDYFGWRIGQYWFPQVRTLPGAIAMMCLTLYPYVYLLARAAFLEQSVCVLEASRTLGRGPWRCFLGVAVPLARPAIVTGLTLVLIETLNDFGTVAYFAVDTFTTGIYRTWFGMGEAAAAAQLACVLMLFVGGLMVLERWARRNDRYHHTTSRYRAIPAFPLTGWRAAAASAACALPIVVGFVLPGIALLVWAAQTAHRTVNAAFVGYAVNSFILASITAAIAVAVAIFLSSTLRFQRNPVLQAAVRVAGLGYAVPGSVIAVGALFVSTWFDAAIDTAVRSHLGVSTGLILTGTIAGVVGAYVVRFLAISYNTLESSLAKITPSLDSAARTLGSRPAAMVRRVHLPLMRGSMLTAGVLVFVDVMKELPATIMMRPFNFDTLAIRAYQLASDEQLRDASAAALGIVLVGIVPVILLSFAIARSRPGHADG
jgi:iron(III) transport system permease protein